MLISNITGVRKVSNLSALADVRSTTQILSANDLMVVSILSGEGTLGNYEPSGYASVKVTIEQLKASLFGYDPVTDSFTSSDSGTFSTTDEYLKIEVGGKVRYVRLYELL